MSKFKIIDVWHVEYAKPDLGSYIIKVDVYQSRENADYCARLIDNDGAACVRVTGPHKHMMPDQGGEQ